MRLNDVVICTELINYNLIQEYFCNLIPDKTAPARHSIATGIKMSEIKIGNAAIAIS